MSHYDVLRCLGLAVALATWACLPSVIATLPEPPAPQLPEAGSADETDLDRMLREEGPKPMYVDVSNTYMLGLSSGWLTLWLAGAASRVVQFPVAMAGIALAPVFVLLAVVDWRTRLLPRIVVLPLTAVVAALAVIDWIVRRDTDALVREVAGGLIAWFVFGLLWFVRRAGMGLGDVRLALPLGMLMAAASWNGWLVGLYAGFVLFAVFAIGLMLVKRDRTVLRKAYPFGPFMIAGAYAGMALGPHLPVIG